MLVIVSRHIRRQTMRVLAGLIALTSTADAQQRRAEATLVFDGVTVVDVEHGTLLPTRRVVIAGRHIQAIGAATSIKLPKGSRVVDGRGKYLIPGLWDLHVHAQQNVDLVYPLLIANGVTGIRDAGSSAPLATLSRWKQEIAAGTRVGPRLIVSGPSLNGPTCGTPREAHHVCVTTPAEARMMVDMLHAMGADMIKTYSMDSTIYFAVAAEARRIGIPFGGHANVGGQAASDSGALILDHDTWFNPFVCGISNYLYAPETISLDGCAAAAQRLRRNGTWISILKESEPSRADIDSLYMPRRLPPGWGRSFHPTSTTDWAKVDTVDVRTATATAIALTRMHRAGMPFVMGTDASAPVERPWFAVPGFAVAEALVSLVIKGEMTPLAALQTATLNPVLAFRMADSLGTIDVGKVADLVLLDADPLADIWNTARIQAVVANGRYYDRPALDRLLDTAAQVVHRYRTGMTGPWPP